MIRVLKRRPQLGIIFSECLPFPAYKCFKTKNQRGLLSWRLHSTFLRRDVNTSTQIWRNFFNYRALRSGKVRGLHGLSESFRFWRRFYVRKLVRGRDPRTFCRHNGQPGRIGHGHRHWRDGPR